ncbi:MAG: crotonase/enoyl-CoA hydratase family protein [Dehalococcoidia bacterium]
MPVSYQTDGPIAIVTIDRPEVANAVDGPTAKALVDAFQRFDDDADLSVGVLVGAHGKFSAGGDLKAIAGGKDSITVTLDGHGPLGPTRMMLSKPVIAAVEGHAVVGGLELALWCDLRVAARDAVFGVYCRRWGVPLCDGGTVRLPRLIGQSRALDMILTGRGVSGEEAFSWGLANRLCEPGQALDTALALARQLAHLPQTCLRSDRKSAYDQWTLDLPAALRHESELGLEVVSSGALFGELNRWQQGEWSTEEFRER